MERAGCAGGDEPSGPGADAKEHSLARRLRVQVVSRTPGRLWDPSWGHQDPCARCSLTARVHRRDTQARTGAEAKPKGFAECRSRAPRGAPVGDPAGHLWAFPEMGPTARRATGAAFRTSAC